MFYHLFRLIKTVTSIFRVPGLSVSMLSSLSEVKTILYHLVRIVKTVTCIFHASYSSLSMLFILLDQNYGIFYHLLQIVKTLTSIFQVSDLSLFMFSSFSKVITAVYFLT